MYSIAFFLCNKKTKVRNYVLQFYAILRPKRIPQKRSLSFANRKSPRESYLTKYLAGQTY